MQGYNKVVLIGTLGAVELKHTQGGQAVLKLRMATSETYVDKAGERQEKTEWHNVTVWGKRAEGLAKVLQKGSGLWVEGKLQTRSWEAQDGTKRYATEVNASDVGLVGGKRDGGGKREQEESGGFGGGGATDGDDIPF